MKHNPIEISCPCREIEDRDIERCNECLYCDTKCHCCNEDKPDTKVRMIGKEAEIELCQECYDLYLEMEAKFRG